MMKKLHHLPIEDQERAVDEILKQRQPEGSFDVDTTQFARLAALIAVMGTAVVYGTDVFCAMVLRPALARVDDRALCAVTGLCTATATGECPCRGQSVSSRPLQAPH